MSLNIKAVEEKYGVTYVGLYDIPGRDEVYVFYQPLPKFDLGHSHYLGLILDYSSRYITMDLGLPPVAYLCDAQTVEEAWYPAYQFEDGTYIASRYRHDYVTRGDVMLDGGLDYVRSTKGITGYAVVRDGKELYLDREMRKVVT